MRTILQLSLIALLTAYAPTTRAQPAPNFYLEAQREAMESVAFLVGEWEGEGWMEMGGGQATFRSTESVESRLDGLALIIEGHHQTDVPGRAEPMVIHHAVAMLTYDSDAEIYRFNSQVHRGGTGRFEGRMVDDAFVWGMTMGGAQIRYTIRIDEEGRWHEIGERSTGDETWTQFFEMTLAPKP